LQHCSVEPPTQRFAQSLKHLNRPGLGLVSKLSSLLELKCYSTPYRLKSVHRM
jgi:hypothetical protein